jgi:hypothetical protein
MHMSVFHWTHYPNTNLFRFTITREGWDRPNTTCWLGAADILNAPSVRSLLIARVMPMAWDEVERAELQRFIDLYHPDAERP